MGVQKPRDPNAGPSGQASGLVPGDSNGRALAALEAHVAWIRRAVEEGHTCAQEGRITGLEKRGDNARALVVTLGLFLAGTLVTVMVNCQQSSERDTEARVLVRHNSENIAKLERTISTLDQQLREDRRVILQEVRLMRQPTAEQWWDDLDPTTKRVIARHVDAQALPPAAARAQDPP